MKPRVRRWLRIATLLSGGVAAGVAVAPEISVRLATLDAQTCLAQAEAPRGVQLPECSGLIRDFDFASGVGYTKHDATYRAEELYARVQVDRYLDAVAGQPDPTRRDKATAHLGRAEDLLARGSRRVSMDELGPAIAAPNVGSLAGSMGDRRTLLATPERFGLWTVRKKVLEAALLEADIDQAFEIAEKYSEWDPRDADLRTTIGAVLCLRDPLSGFGVLERVVHDRADKRYANIQRNYGELLLAQRACANKAGLGDPRPPSESGAGEYDERDLHLVFEWRQSLVRPADAAARASSLLQTSKNVSLDLRGTQNRALLLAVYVESQTPIDTAALLGLLGEKPLAPGRLVVRDLLAPHEHSRVVLGAARIQSAVDKVKLLADRTEDPASTIRLLTLAAALTQWRAVALSEEGQAEAAAQAAREATLSLAMDPRAASLSAASVAFVAGRTDLALAALREGEPGKNSALELEHKSLWALLLAATGDLAAARIEAQKLAEATVPSTERAVGIEARLTAVALGDIGQATPRSGPFALAYLGFADRSKRYLQDPETRSAAWADTLRSALESAPEDRRAFRYQLLRRRGDLSQNPILSLVYGGRLLDDDVDGSGVEVYLDALAATDLSRYRLSDMAFFRQQAATIRGDSDNAALWGERRRELLRLANEPEHREIAAFLGL